VRVGSKPVYFDSLERFDALGVTPSCQLKPKPIPRAEKRPWRCFWLLSSRMARANRKHLVEDAELRVQRGQRNIDRQAEVISALERDNQDTTIAKALLKIFGKANEIHVADRDRLIKELKEGAKAPG